MADALAPDALIQVASGFMAAQYLAVANEVGLFAALAAAPATLATLTEHLQLPPRAMRILVDAMVALGFVERHGDQYQNGPLAATFLSGQTETDLRPFVRFMQALSYPLWLHLTTAIHGTKVPPMQLSTEQQDIFVEGIEALMTEAAMVLARTYDFGRHHRLLAPGRGTGSFLLAVLRMHPHIAGTLFEAMPAVPAVQAWLAHTPGSAGVELVVGNLFKDAIPEGHDVIILAIVMHLLSADNNRLLLQRIHARVKRGARLLLVGLWTDPTHTQPAFAALLAGEFLMVTGEGDVYSREEVQSWLSESGWQFVEQQPLAGPISVIVAEAIG